MKLLSAALLAGGLLAGCASTPPGLPAPRDQVRNFTLDARFALMSAEVSRLFAALEVALKLSKPE